MNREYIHPALAEADGVRQVALVRVGEECAELTKEAAKALRFGLENRYPADGLTNAEKMAAEYHDIGAALADAGIITPPPRTKDEIAAAVDAARCHRMFRGMRCQFLGNPHTSKLFHMFIRSDGESFRKSDSELDAEP